MKHQHYKHYCFLQKLERIFRRPFGVLKHNDITIRHKRRLLIRWKHDRARMLYEYAHGRDYTNDNKVQEIDEALEIIKVIKAH